MKPKVLDFRLFSILLQEKTAMYKRLWQQLTALYGEGEAKGIVRLLLEVRFGLTWTDIVCGKADELSADDQAALKTMMQRLEQGEPVQYVVGMAEFGGRMFHVEPGVLIPRPETYELCEWIIEEKGEILEEKGKRREERDYHILDVGTGSGCIACTLAAEMPEVRGARVAAWDISEEALAVAQKNAKLMGVEVRFEKQDALCPLEERGERREERWDLIVSNPPYICNKEREAMERNVLEHEPQQALFVPDDDPLQFYRAIAQYGQHALKPEGWLFFEINPLYAKDMQEMLSMMSYHDIEMKTDQFGKQRMIKAQR
jgi:release factor glutamine methyltransferase